MEDQTIRIEKENERLKREREEGVKVVALSSVLLSGKMTKLDKDMPPGAVFMVTQREYEKLSKPQRPKFSLDPSDEWDKSMIDFIRSQPGGVDKLESLKSKSGPAVKKARKTAKISDFDELKALRRKRKKKLTKEVQEIAQSLEVNG